MLFALVSACFAMACSRGIDGAYQTLPKVGSAVPAFSYPGVVSDTVTSASLQDGPAVIALWSSTCGASREALASIRLLAADYASRGVRVVLLADDADATTLHPLFLDVGPLRVGVAAGALRGAFSQTKIGPWRRALALPSFLVVGRTGVIVDRQVGIEQAIGQRLLRLRAQLDTMLVREAGG